MSYLIFDWLFGKSVPQAPPPSAEITMQKITIAGEDCEVTAHKVGKVTWKAYGYVRGMPIQAADDTAHAAFRRWRDLAKTMLNH